MAEAGKIILLNFNIETKRLKQQPTPINKFCTSCTFYPNPDLTLVAISGTSFPSLLIIINDIIVEEGKLCSWKVNDEVIKTIGEEHSSKWTKLFQVNGSHGGFAACSGYY